VTAKFATSELIEEVIITGFHDGHVAFRNPRLFAEITANFVETKTETREISDLAADPVTHNHLAYLMAAPTERLDDSLIDEYAELAEYILRAIAFADSEKILAAPPVA